MCGNRNKPERHVFLIPGPLPTVILPLLPLLPPSLFPSLREAPPLPTSDSVGRDSRGSSCLLAQPGSRNLYPTSELLQYHKQSLLKDTQHMGHPWISNAVKGWEDGKVGDLGMRSWGRGTVKCLILCHLKNVLFVRKFTHKLVLPVRDFSTVGLCCFH